MMARISQNVNQGHWVKGQGQIGDFAENFVLTVDHEPFVGFNSNLVYMLTMILSMCCIKVKVIRSRVKVKLACQSSTSVSGYN